MEIREGDVFRFRYNKEEAAKQFEPYHCFDGQLIALKKQDGTIHLVDTYWMISFDKADMDCRKFTPEQAQEKGELEFKCNLNDIEYISKEKTQYYKDEDVINLTYHRGFKKVFAVMKGTEPDLDSATLALEEKLRQKRDSRDCLNREIESLKEKIGEAKQGKFPNVI